MIDHRTNIKAYIEAAEGHIENPLVAEKLHEFWKAYDKLAAVVKLVDDGEIVQAADNQMTDVERYIKNWTATLQPFMKTKPISLSSKLDYDNPNWEEDEMRGK